MKKTFKEEKSIEILKILGLINNMNEYIIYIAPNKYLISFQKNMVEENIR